MIAHIVLFRPRRDLSTQVRQTFVAAFEAALREIPSIRRVRVGRRLVLGRAYDRLMHVDYSYAAVLEFDDHAGLMGYLEHPAHEQLAVQFFNTFEEALMYDFELHDATAELAALLPDTH